MRDFLARDHRRHVEDYYNRDTPDGLYELLDELGSAYAYFEGRKGEEMGRGQDYQNARQDAYDAHCMEKALLHPDGERAKGLLAKGEFPDYEDICREILLVDYPEEVPHESARPWTSCPGRTFWMRCFLGTEQRAWRCGGPCWTSRSLF